MQFKERMSLERNLGWTPNPQPPEMEEVPEYLFNELTTLSKALFQLKNMHLDRVSEFPPKPRDGDMALIDDGTQGGLYLYDRDHWIELNVGTSGGGGGSMPVGGIIMWTGDIPPDGWAICDGTPAPNGMQTPDMQDRFIKGSGAASPGATGGSTNTGSHVLTEVEMPLHRHGMETGVIGTSGSSHTPTLNSNGDHNHGSFIPGSEELLLSGSNWGRRFPLVNTTMPNAGSHSHSMPAGGNHNHDISGKTGYGGASGGHDHTIDPIFYAVAFIMRYE